MKKILTAAAMILAFAALSLGLPKDAYASTKELSPGTTYDVSDAGWNTTVNITQAGDYYLKGQSSNVRIVVQSGGVNLYLEDGLDINCSITSNTGARTGAITVEEQGGSFVLRSGLFQ